MNNNKRTKRKASVRIPLILVFCSLLSALCQFGCGYTIHDKASLPFTSIKIGTIENKTVEPKLQDRLYRASDRRVSQAGDYRSPDAGYKISGTIQEFSMLVLSEKADIAAEYEIVMKGDFTLSTRRERERTERHRLSVHRLFFRSRSSGRAHRIQRTCIRKGHTRHGNAGGRRRHLPMSFKAFLSEIEKGLPETVLSVFCGRSVSPEGGSRGDKRLVPETERDFNLHVFDLSLSGMMNHVVRHRYINVANTVSFFGGRRFTLGIGNPQKLSKKDQERLNGYVSKPAPRLCFCVTPSRGLQ